MWGRAIFDNWKTTLGGVLLAVSLWIAFHPEGLDPWLVEWAKGILALAAAALGLAARDTQRGHDE